MFTQIDIFVTKLGKYTVSTRMAFSVNFRFQSVNNGSSGSGGGGGNGSSSSSSC